MKDLQELFESMGTDAFNNLAELVEKKNINPRNQQIIIDMISLVSRRVANRQVTPSPFFCTGGE